MGYDELIKLAESYPTQDRDAIPNLARQYSLRQEREILELAALAADVGLDDVTSLGLEPDANPQLLQAIELYTNKGLDALTESDVNGIKGKYFEVLLAEKLNAGESVGGIQLSPGEVVRLAESPSQPGWDLAIVNENGETVDEIQAKATNSLSYVKGALDKYPDIQVITTQELSDKAADYDNIASSDISNADITEEATEHIEEFSEDLVTDILHQSAEFAFDAIPAVSAVVIGLSEGRQVLLGRSTVEESLRRGTVRLGRSSVYSVIGAGLMAADAGIISIPTVTVLRIAEGRVRHRMAMERHLEEKTAEIVREVRIALL